MVKFLAKLAEKYAKRTNTACVVWFFIHQPKMTMNRKIAKMQFFCLIIYF